MMKAEENFIYLKKKVDTTLKLLKFITYTCAGILIALFILNMYFNWLYRGPWDDSMLKEISFITLLIDCPCLIISGMLEYSIKN